VEDDRLSAYIDVLREAGIPIDESLIRLGVYYCAPPLPSSFEGYQHTESLLALKERPTAIFANCDILAAGTLQVLYRAGLSVPQDISVIGFDDTLAADLTPPLTTVAQPMSKLGEVAFQFAIKAMQEPDRADTFILETQLIERMSTGTR
jgi:LacI family transcriptional regulator